MAYAAVISCLSDNLLSLPGKSEADDDGADGEGLDAMIFKMFR